MKRCMVAVMLATGLILPQIGCRSSNCCGRFANAQPEPAITRDQPVEIAREPSVADLGQPTESVLLKAEPQSIETATPASPPRVSERSVLRFIQRR
jgi:hypothetical protein